MGERTWGDLFQCDRCGVVMGLRFWLSHRCPVLPTIPNDTEQENDGE